MVFLNVILCADFSNFKEFGSVWKRSYGQTFDFKANEDSH